MKKPLPTNRMSVAEKSRVECSRQKRKEKRMGRVEMGIAGQGACVT